MQEYCRYFNELIAQGKLSHGYVFTGDDYLGKKALVIEIIQALACRQSQREERPCGECDLCVRAQHNQLADINYIQPDGQYIKVDQIRQLKEWFATSSLEVGFKLAVIESAEMMNTSAANALLNLLEEPGENIYLILFTQNMNGLLPTIQSRVQRIHFSAPAEESFRDQLLQQGVEANHANVMVRLSSETIEKMMEDYQVDEFSSWFKALDYYFASLVQRSPRAFIQVQTELKTYIQGSRGVDSLEYLLILTHSSLLFLIGNQEQLVHGYFLKKVLSQHTVSQGQLIALNDLLIQAKEKILAHVPSQLVFEQLALLVLK